MSNIDYFQFNIKVNQKATFCLLYFYGYNLNILSFR